MAILGNAKRFIRSPSAQKVIGESMNEREKPEALIYWVAFVDGIWSGKIIYQALNQHAIIADVSARMDTTSRGKTS